MNIVDGDTFDVSPGWQWENSIGSRVRPTGFDAPETGERGALSAKRELLRLLIGKKVVLGPAYRVDRGRLVCDVFFRGKALASYLT